MQTIWKFALFIAVLLPLPGQANIIWDFNVGTSAGEIVSTGNLEDINALVGKRGSVGFEILSFQFTGTTHPVHPENPNLPNGEVWSFTGGSVGANWDFSEKLLFSASINATTPLSFPVSVLGVDLVLMETQSLSIFQNPAQISDNVSYIDYERCAADTAHDLGIGVPPVPCTDINYRPNVAFDLAPRGNVVSAVTEPSTLALLGLGALVLVRRRHT